MSDAMTDKQTLSALLERVKQAKGADREIDRDLRYLFVGKPIWEIDPTGTYERTDPEPYTDSIDASLALCERVLPGKWRPLLRAASARADTLQALPLALLAALLEAMLAQCTEEQCS